MSPDKKFIKRTDLARIVKKLRKSGRSIVLTNGAFDILHPGHIIYLKEAKKLGNILIVGLNTDESIKRYKSADRPINGFKDRCIVLSELSSVDYITPLIEERPAKLIKIIKPDTYVKGGDYKREQLHSTPIVEKLGGKIITIPFVGKYSTTAIVNRIKLL